MTRAVGGRVFSNGLKSVGTISAEATPLAARFYGGKMTRQKL